MTNISLTNIRFLSTVLKGQGAAIDKSSPSFSSSQAVYSAISLILHSNFLCTRILVLLCSNGDIQAILGYHSYSHALSIPLFSSTSGTACSTIHCSAALSESTFLHNLSGVISSLYAYHSIIHQTASKTWSTSGIRSRNFSVSFIFAFSSPQTLIRSAPRHT